MKALDLASSLFWLLLSMAAFLESFRMGIGTVQRPGMGLMPFGASALLCILSMVLLIRTIFKKREDGVARAHRAFSQKKALTVLFAAISYSIVMPRAGYLVSTFFLMTFVYWLLEPNRVRALLRGVVLALLTTILSYALFAVLLNCPFPAGILGF